MSLHKNYDENNTFWQILTNKLPCKEIHSSNHCLAFQDIHPQDKIHILVIPKKQYADFETFLKLASEEEKIDWLNTIQHILSIYSHTAGKIMINIGEYQEVKHLHAHIMIH